MKFIADKKVLDTSIIRSIKGGAKIEDVFKRHRFSIMVHSDWKPDGYIKYIMKSNVSLITPKQKHYMREETGKLESYWGDEMHYAGIDLSHITWDKLSKVEKTFYNSNDLDKNIKWN